MPRLGPGELRGNIGAMEPAFWIGRWKEGRIAFHEGRTNVYLERYESHLAAARRVFVPLCGKTEDLAYLAGRGHEVVGVELVEDAVRAFFAEHGVTPTVTQRGAFTVYEEGSITLLTGNLFDATPELLGPIDALYDRAALIALPSDVRARYVERLRTLLPRDAPGLVVTLEYPQDRMDGPPFSVLEAELRAHYHDLDVELLEEGPANVPRLLETNVPGVEKCFRVQF